MFDDCPNGLIISQKIRFLDKAPLIRRLPTRDSHPLNPHFSPLTIPVNIRGSELLYLPISLMSTQLRNWPINLETTWRVSSLHLVACESNAHEQPIGPKIIFQRETVHFP